MPKDKVKGPTLGRAERGALGPTQKKFVVGGILGVLGAGVPQWRLSQEQQRPTPIVPRRVKRGRGR
jgi:hypothetical protein